MQQIARLDRENIVARCKAVIMELPTNGELSTAAVARDLHMSTRTLTRRLQAQGAAFDAEFMAAVLGKPKT